ncbi:NAD(+) synthase [Brachybacterium ginsengisoli]|uniref:Glutamine-dependent NAD(+) synthetase n=1 Tax=Brachybacterium ginsengisoli TaxID=1331682 RepID=A0A291GU17_9MICO|nr:NAD(+) synthase [Brachybacterium ginsengisoli]ATG53723.1 NAD(+) synthase [Brachybacterium ginsengisoli]
MSTASQPASPKPTGQGPAQPSEVERAHALERALPTITHEDPSDPHASIYDHGFLRAAAVTLPVALADPATNAERHLEVLRDLHEQQVGLAVFPELSLTGYSLDDLVMQEPLLDAAEQAVLTVLEASEDLMPIIVLGAPLRAKDRSRIFNCAVVIHRGQILGISPKQNLPTYREFYERRWFAPGDDACDESVVLGGQFADLTPHGIITVDDVPGLKLYVEICEDMWVPIPPSAEAALAGATVIVNLSGSPITIGRAEDRKLLARSSSARTQSAYVYAAAGEGESTTDLAWDGQTFVYECGDLLGETERFPQGPRATIADIDLDRLVAERRRQNTFDDNRRTHETSLEKFQTWGETSLFGPWDATDFWDEQGEHDEDEVEDEEMLAPILLGRRRGAAQARHDAHAAETGEELPALRTPPPTGPLRRKLDRFPFVPDDPARLAQDCYEAFSIQVAGLVRRLSAIGGDKPGGARPVLGVSGGLDSTHALLVCARAMDLLGRDRSEILTYTMPGFATTEHTRSNAELLSTAIGASFETLDIRPAATQMLKDMHHPFGDGEEVYDVTFENVQAGLRYDYLFRLANHLGGIVVGTGDLSELALGWCTYGVGDHMSHYGVNAGVPKTLIQHLIRWVIAEGLFGDDATGVLQAVLDTEITPELIPTREGEKAQSTEDSIGPYALHDFFLYHLLRRGDGPAKTAYLAHQAWGDVEAGEWPAGYLEADKRSFTRGEIKHWLTVFTKRFFSNQFKRSALPNAPKVLAGGSLSPRGDWRMPSDAASRAWLAEIDAEVPGD